MLGMEAYIEYLNKSDKTVLKALEVLDKGESFPKAPEQPIEPKVSDEGTKKQLRKQIAQEKRRHGITELITKSAALLEKLEQHPKFASARTVLLYYSLDDEVQTHDFVENGTGRKQFCCR